MRLLRPLIQKVPTVARVPNRAVLSVTGSQVQPFLNGILASHVGEQSFYSAFLHAQGKVLYDVFLHAHSTPDGKPGFLIEHDSRPSEAPALLQLLKRYVLRAKVKIRDVSDEYDVWAAWGSEKESAWETQRQWTWAKSGAVEPNWKDAPEWPWGTTTGTIRDRRAVGMGERLLIRKGDLPPQATTYNQGDEDAYLLHRILHGVPEGIDDIVPMQSFPMDSDLDFMGGLDFRKGCYVGQELTVRTYHTGVIRKRIHPVVIEAPQRTEMRSTSPLPSNLEIRPTITRSPEDTCPVARVRGTGKLLSNTQATDGTRLGLALLRSEHVEGAERGEVKFSINVPGHEDGGSWAVSHWVPEWWPQRSEDEENVPR